MQQRNDWLLRQWSWFFLVLLLVLGLNPAHATLPSIKLPGAYIQDLPEQPGIPLQQFQLPIQLENLGESTQGDVTFEVTSASMGDLQGLRVSKTPFSSKTAQDQFVTRPQFTAEGMYRVKAHFSSNSFQSDIYFWILLKDGLVYYSSDTGSIVNSIAAYRLKNHSELNQLKRKAAAVESQRKNVQPGSVPRLMNETLSGADLQKYQQIWQDEVEEVSNSIPRKSLESKAILKAGPIAKGDTVKVKINWPTDASYTRFLPLQGAKILVANLANVTDPNNLALYEQGVFARGELDTNGEFTFVAPVDNLNYRVWLIGEHTNFKMRVFNRSSNTAENLILKMDQITTVNIIPGQAPFLYSSEYAQAWSVFQAMFDLSNNVASVAGVSTTPIFPYVNTNMNLGGGANFDPNTGYMNIDAVQSYVWDAIAHEYGHAVSRANRSIIGAGGSHDGSNQYDYAVNPNPGTFRNKQVSNRLALEEGFAHWFAVTYWKSSKYANKLNGVGDDAMHLASASGAVGSIDLESSAPIPGLPNVYGEDSEFAVARFLWDMTDAGNEANQRASCSKYCSENIQQPLSTVMQRVISGKMLDGVSGFYQGFFQLYTGGTQASLETVGTVPPAAVAKLFEIGAVSAEFGLGANLNSSDNADPFRDVDSPSRRDLDKNPVQLKWKQLKTGTMPGLDQFELLFYSEGLDKLLFKLNVGRLAATGNEYTYQMPRAQVQALVNALQKNGYQQEYKLAVVVKGVASGQGVINGVVNTGPYYGNAEILSVKLGEKKYAVIAVDSSGSNLDTDPSNLRIQAAQSMLEKMAERNASVMSGQVVGKPLAVAAMDFDAGASWLSDFTEPKVLSDNKVFQSIDSNGGTDIAQAIRLSTRNLVAVRPVPNPPVYDLNTPRMFLLTDMDNNAGLGAVTTAINEATQSNVLVNLGHLQPLTVKQARVQSGSIGGDPVRLLKVAEPMDPVIAAILAGGGTYSSIEDASAQQAWVNLMDELSQIPPFTATTVNLPLNVKYYGFAQAAGQAQPTFVFTAPVTGQVTVTVDGKGSFVPALNAGGTTGQAALGNDLYALPFNVVSGQTYQITLNEPAGASGLYSIVLRQSAVGATPSTLSLSPIADVTEGTAPTLNGTTTNVADGARVSLTIATAAGSQVVNATVTANAFTATGPANLPKGAVTVTADIAGSGAAPSTQRFNVLAKVVIPPVVLHTTAVPVDHPLALFLLAAVVTVGAGRRLKKASRR